ncbi:MAG: efflux RND transporter periplasmic adaptor subunit [Acidimicrobiia bacterium]|nr:efflux RND transporter periplasmic adaptor subunit [Acidimicrobiia bacterium]
MKMLHASCTLLVVMASFAACRSVPLPVSPAGEGEIPSHAVTTWTERTELFMEYPPLVAGSQARFAIHLTDLDDFSPLGEGRVVVRFEGDTIHRFDVDGPSTPGIFGVDVEVPAARRYQMAVELHGTGFDDEHAIGAVTVYEDTAAAAAAVPEEEEGATSFLKEQQWTLEFATARVEAGVRPAVLRVPGTIEPRAGGSAEVLAPAPGRIAAGDVRAVGAPVNRGAALVELIVRNDRLGEAPVLRLELAQTESELRLATEELARVERLASAGAVPARRLTEARIARETAAARVDIAREQLLHLELSRTGEGAGSAEERVLVRSPIAGVVADAGVTRGAAVEEGQLLYRVVAVDRVHVVGAVPEQDVARVQEVTAAEIDVPGLTEPLKTTRLVTIGRVVDHATRSVPITFELVHPPAGVAVGQAVTLRLITSGGGAEVAVPSSAVVDDGGQPIVFVQAGGESFERRPVRVGGEREGGYVHIVSGLDRGERIVTRGAHLVRLAALSPQAPGHGHVH